MLQPISFLGRDSDFLEGQCCFFNEKIVNYGKLCKENFKMSSQESRNLSGLHWFSLLAKGVKLTDFCPQV